MSEFNFDLEIQDIKDLIDMLLGDAMIPKNVKNILQNIGSIIEKEGKYHSHHKRNNLIGRK